MPKVKIDQEELLEKQGYECISITDPPHGYYMEIYYRKADGHAMRSLRSGNLTDEYLKWTEEEFEKFKKKHKK